VASRALTCRTTLTGHVRWLGSTFVADVSMASGERRGSAATGHRGQAALNPSPEEISKYFAASAIFSGRSALAPYGTSPQPRRQLGNGSIRSTCHIKILESGIMTFFRIFNSETANPGSRAGSLRDGCGWESRIFRKRAVESTPWSPSDSSGDWLKAENPTRTLRRRRGFPVGGPTFLVAPAAHPMPRRRYSSNPHLPLRDADAARSAGRSDEIAGEARAVSEAGAVSRIEGVRFLIASALSSLCVCQSQQGTTTPGRA